MSALPSLTGRDWAGTVARLRHVRAERIQPVLGPARRSNRQADRDGALIEFAGAVEELLLSIEAIDVGRLHLMGPEPKG